MAEYPILTNAQVSSLVQLAQKKFRTERGTFLVEGWKGVADALASNWQVVQVVVSNGGLASSLANHSILPNETYLVDEFAMEKISQLTTPPGIVAEVVWQETSLAEVVATGKPLLYCDGVADPGNMGTIIRTADWFGVAGILLGSGCVEVGNPKVVQATMGSLFHLSYSAETNVELLKKAGYQLVVTDPLAGPARSLSPKMCIVIGSESHGINPELMAQGDIHYGIPGSGTAESLNASVAAGITMFDLLAKS